MCLAGAVVASWSLTQEVAGLSPFAVMTNIFVTGFSEFSENILENSNLSTVNARVTAWLTLHVNKPLFSTW